MLNIYSKLPFLGSAELQKNAKDLLMANSKISDLYEQFAHFTINSWIYESNQVYELEAQMTPEERSVFFLDTKQIDWL